MGFADVGNENRLITGTPVSITGFDFASKQFFQDRFKFNPNRDRVTSSAANVENLSFDLGKPLEGGVIGITQVIHKKDIPHLLSVAVNGNRFSA